MNARARFTSRGPGTSVASSPACTVPVWMTLQVGAATTRLLHQLGGLAEAHHVVELKHGWRGSLTASVQCGSRG